MAKKLKRRICTWFVATAFKRHIKELHGAEYDVCEDPTCRLAMWVELRWPELWL